VSTLLQLSTYMKTRVTSFSALDSFLEFGSGRRLGGIRAVLAKAFHDWITLITRHFDCGDNRRTKSFAGLVVTPIEGAYVRCRPERTSGPFKEAGAWLSELAKDQE
jgi:hypothetical protein